MLTKCPSMKPSSRQFYLDLYRGHYIDHESFFILPAAEPTSVGIRECLCGRSIQSLPSLLVIQLIQPQPVDDYQLTLDLNELLPGDNKYLLFATVLFQQEHYTSVCYSSEINKWIYYRSINVTLLSQFSSPIISEASYLLFYRKETIPWEDPHSSSDSSIHETPELINPNTTSPPSNRPSTPNPQSSSPKQPAMDVIATPPTSQKYSPFHQHVLHSTGPSRSVPHTNPQRKIHKPSVCAECGIELHSSNITRHRLTHQFPCTECNSSFPTNELLQKHHQKMHPLDILYECPYKDCAYASERWSLYRQHIQRVHLVKRFQCPECHIIVQRRDNFIRHMNQQHPDKPAIDPSHYRMNMTPEEMDTVQDIYPHDDFNEIMNISGDST